MSEQPLITQDELDILNASMQIAQRQVRQGKSAEVALYDFREAAKLSPDQTNELKHRCVVLSKVLSRTLSAYLNAPLAVAFEGLDHPSFDQYLRGLPPNPILAVFHLDPHTAPAVWQIDLPVAVSLVNTMLGSKQGSTGPHPSDLTAIEQALLTRLFDEILQTWALTWPALSQFAPSVERLTCTVANLDISAYAQDIVHASFRFSIGEVSGPAHLALPHESLQRLLRAAGHNRPGAAAPSSVALDGPVSHQAQKSRVPLVARLVTLRLPLGRLAALKPGDVLPLPTDPSQSVTVTVAGAPKFEAEAGQWQSHRAVRITGSSSSG